MNFRRTLLQFVTYSSLLAPAVQGSPSATVAGLPACNAAANGQIYTVTNLLAPVLGSVIAGGGAVTAVVHCNGTNWVGG